MSSSSHHHISSMSSMSASSSMSKQQQQQSSGSGGATTTATTTIYIVRYGLTEFPLVENEGPFDSDIDPSSGIEHANAIASRLAADISSSLSSTSRKDINIMVFSSPFLRTCHTASIISAKVSSALESTVAVKIEEGLTEWQIPSLLVTPDGTKTEPRMVVQLAKLFPNIIDSSYTSVNPFQDDWFPNPKIDYCNAVVKPYKHSSCYSSRHHHLEMKKLTIIIL
jgi:hypothetical protein